MRLLFLCAVAAAACASPPALIAPGPPSAPESVPLKVNPDVVNFRSPRRYAVTRRPVAVRIPAVSVDTTLETLDRLPDGTVEVPVDWNRAGWYRGGARPGAPGPAIILGHVDSRSGPAVFYRLRELRAGDEIFVEQRGGREMRFVVQRVEQHDKDAFPTDAVYFPTLRPTLRLVTCGGSFDHSTGHYRDNIIVFARLAQS